MRRLILVCAVLLATGCASLAPERQRPIMPVPDVWPDATTAGGLGTVLGWREVFPDPALQNLIVMALNENRSLRQVVLAMD